MKPANKQIIPFPRPRDSRQKDELAFLPAALEIVETPASPLGRAVGLIIVVLFSAALAWACIGKVDIIASAHGKIIPSGRTKVIQPFETGVVRAIHVRDGQKVKAGDVLIELDPTMNQAEGGQLRNDLIAARLEMARLEASLAAVADPLAKNVDPLAHFYPPPGASPDSIATQKRFLLDAVSEHRAKLVALERQQAQKEAERATAAATIEKIKASLAILDQRVDIRETLYNSRIGSKWNYLEILQAQTEQKQELKVQQSRIQEAEAAISALIATREQTIAEFGRTRSGELAEAQRKAGGLAQSLIKTEEKVRLQVMTASVDGVVQQLAVHTIGGVVTPAQTLLVLVPQESHLEIEAMVSNRDIGFVQAGQSAEIKVDTFNFTRYGLLHGTVLSVSQDAISRDKQPDGGKTASSEEPTSEPKGQELNYAARVSLDRTQMQVDDKLVNLSPGMAVTVEIKTGERRIIGYLLSPLLKYRQESLRER
jgi:membrane fusion protein, hemolysin D